MKPTRLSRARRQLRSTHEALKPEGRPSLAWIGQGCDSNGQVTADQKLVEFLEGVLSKTKAGRIPRGPTAQESSFIAAIAGQFSLSNSDWVEPVFLAEGLAEAAKGTIDRYTLVVRDLHGRVLATVTENDEGIRPDAMQELYETARRQAVHAGERIDDALAAPSQF
jgi:hypothetical protein